MEASLLRLPSILPSSNSLINSDRPLTVKLSTNAYEQWRTSIHRQLEDDLQRQVRELIDQSEREERLAKLARRTGQSSFSSPPESEQPIDNRWTEIDRHNHHVLYPIHAKSSHSPSRRFSFYPPLPRTSKKGFQLSSSSSSFHYRQQQRRDEQTTPLMNPSAYLTKYFTKQSSLGPFNSDSSFLFGNSIIKSNKAEILNAFEQQLINGEESTTYVDRHGVKITEDGPFWPETYRILHPAPKLLNRNALGKELYLSSSSQRRQTFDNQPALYKYTDVFKHPVIVYDMDKTARQQPIKIHDDEHMCPQLIFESRFEGGNLRQVKRVGQLEYELVLRPDLYTRRHTQWYFFRVQNMLANVTYRFRIINLTKKNSLYNEGMQILLFSDVDSKKQSQGWHRVGHHINYAEHRQRTYNLLLEREMTYYQLDFQFEFGHSGDTCYIAHCYPYTFTDLKDDLDYLSTIRPRHIFRRDVLCESRAGNSCFLITVTDESVPIQKKKFVFITARIHPGETNSSYMMRGLLEFITSNEKMAQKLRSQLVFKIIPMLNPDGVIVGNYRCSLTGKDMNRNFRHPRKQTFPIVYHIKELIHNLQREQREILAFCDLHGHSRKSNVFAYGCDGSDGPQRDMKDFLNARVLPFLMSRTAPDMFAFDYCKFHIHRCKESTGRVVMWKEMLIKNSFTLEASFGGSSIVEKPCHFNIDDFEKFGRCICQSLEQYLEILSDSTRMDSIFLDITRSLFLRLDRDKVPSELFPFLYPEEKASDTSINSLSKCLDVLTQYHDTLHSQDSPSSSDSDSDPEGGELPDIGYCKESRLSKKKSKKHRVDKSLEERVQKANNKREMEKANRNLPQRGSLFTSKYANRTGNGLPIFTTERALERRHQTRSDSVLQEGPKNESDEPDPSSPVKRTASLLALPSNDLLSIDYDPLRNSQITAPIATLKSLPAAQRRVLPMARSSAEPLKLASGMEFDRISNVTPAIITMPNLIECATRFHRSTSIAEGETSIDGTLLRSFPRGESRSRLSIAGGQSRSTPKRYFSDRINDYVVQQPLSSMEILTRERPITATLETNYSTNPIGRVNSLGKKRLY